MAGLGTTQESGVVPGRASSSATRRVPVAHAVAAFDFAAQQAELLSAGLPAGKSGGHFLPSGQQSDICVPAPGQASSGMLVPSSDSETSTALKKR